MPNRSQLARIAAETLTITQTGEYVSATGRSVSIRSAIENCVETSTLYTPNTARSLRTQAERELHSRSFSTQIQVTNETTLSAAHRLVHQFGPGRVGALNFASAKNPGGGFLNGSQAQEESLARATALYPSLTRHMTYYDANRRHQSSLYTDHLIVSPDVPVFRDDDGRLIDDPWELTILTSPAPNAGAISRNEPHALDGIPSTFHRRIEQILSAAVVHQLTALVLGAWGCGVFANDPQTVAQAFAHHLLPPAPFHKAFEHITFAVLDRGGQTFAAFADVLGGSNSSDSPPRGFTPG